MLHRLRSVLLAASDEDGSWPRQETTMTVFTDGWQGYHGLASMLDAASSIAYPVLRPQLKFVFRFNRGKRHPLPPYSTRVLGTHFVDNDGFCVG